MRYLIGLLCIITITFEMVSCKVSEAVYLKSNDATLKEITLSIGELMPRFSSKVTSYNILLPENVTTITVSGKTNSPNALLSPKLGTAVTVYAGTTKVSIQVTAEDGSKKQEYTIWINRISYTSANIGKMMLVPAGQYYRDYDPLSLSIVDKPFNIGQFEISRAQYYNIMGIDPSGVAYSNGLTDPVQQVNWYQAISFCNKLSISEGLLPVYGVAIGGTQVNFATLPYSSIPLATDSNWDSTTHDFNANGYRLPTELEWMWAAMGAQDSRDKPFAGSTGSNTIGDYAVYGFFDSPRTSGQTSFQRSEPSGSKYPNELGILDLTGNVSEWCWDSYGTYGAGTLHSDSSSGWGSASIGNRVFRGGGWGSTSSNSTVSFRGSTYPFSRAIDIGFRVVRN